EDGIRYWSVTGVQTCALPIWAAEHVPIREPMRVIVPLRDPVTARAHHAVEGPACGRERPAVFRGDYLLDQRIDDRIGDAGKVVQIGRASCRERREIWEGRRVL